MVQLFCDCVLRAASTLRASSGMLRLLPNVLPGLPRGPAANTGEMWLLQLGLHELERPKESAADWVWLVDHAVQLGPVRCLFVVGVRVAVWRELERPLESCDLQVFALEPVKKSDGPIVAQQLEDLSARTGITPRAVLNDQGGDLKKGVELFLAKRPEAAPLHDVAHQAANELKRELQADPRWSAFLGLTGTIKQRLALTPLAHLAPPSLRSKARYMNLGELVSWGQRLLRYLQQPHPVAGEPLDEGLLQEKLGAVANFAAALAEWGAALAVTEATLTYVRRHGYHAAAASELAPLLAGAPAGMPARVAERLAAFVAGQSAAARPGEHLPGSTECLESLIGTGKRLEGQHRQSGFTKVILATAAAVVQPTTELIQTALAAVRPGDVLTWCRERLGMSLAAKRQLALAGGTEPG